MDNFIIATDQSMYLVKFRGASTRGSFICSADKVGECVKQWNRNGLDSIKKFNAGKAKFESLSKTTLKNYFSFHTDTMEELKKANFFK